VPWKVQPHRSSFQVAADGVQAVEKGIVSVTKSGMGPYPKGPSSTELQLQNMHGEFKL